MIVSTLSEQFELLAHKLSLLNIEPEQWFSRQDIFNSSIFNTHSDDINDYLVELKRNIDKLMRIQDTQYAGYIAETITQQFSALKQLAHAVSVNDSAKQYQKSHRQQLQNVKKLQQQAYRPIQSLYAELSELKEFERRLIDMVSDKQALLHKAEQNNKHELQQQVLTTQQRLGRCRQAISQVEEQIQQLESQN